MARPVSGCLRELPLDGTGVAELPPRFENGNGNGVRQIHAAVLGHHWQADFLLRRQRVENFGRQPAAFRTEDKNVAGLKSRAIRPALPFGGQRENAAPFQGFETIFEILVYRQFCKLVIIQTCARLVFLPSTNHENKCIST